jgi:hypothetical protein
MVKKATAQNIVITLKNRKDKKGEQGVIDADADDDDDDDDGVVAGETALDSDDGEADQPPVAKSEGGGDDARHRDRSRSRSPPGRPSPSPDAAAPELAPETSGLNLGKLEDIFSTFHGELDTFLQEENKKMKEAAADGQEDRDVLKRVANRVSGFLRDVAPRDHEDLGPDPAGLKLASRSLPRLLEILEEDRRALEDAVAIMTTLAERRFPKSDELEKLKSEDSPLPLLRAVLRLLAEDAPSAAEGGGKAGASGAGAAGARRRGGRGEGEGSSRQGRKPPPPADDGEGAAKRRKEDGDESYSYSEGENGGRR